MVPIQSHLYRRTTRIVKTSDYEESGSRTIEDNRKRKRIEPRRYLPVALVRGLSTTRRRAKKPWFSMRERSTDLKKERPDDRKTR
jgi:hypothetical protein